MFKLFRFPRRYRPAAALVSVLATTLVGVAAAAPAASASITPTCQWQALPLIGGWTSQESAYATGDPSFCISNQMVYLSGSVAQTGPGTGSEFAALPQAAWPSSTLYLNVYTLYGKPGVLRIDTDGAMFAYYGSATGFTSLAGVSFPVAGAATTPLPLTDGWWSAASQYGTGDPAVLITGDAVHLEGSAETYPGSLASQVTVLPADAWPNHDEQIPVYLYGGMLGQLGIASSTGQVFACCDGATGFTSFAGVSYPTAAASAYAKQLGLINGWQSYSGSVAPSYVLDSGVAYLYGALTLTSANPEFAVLPAGLRPAHNLFILVHFEEPGSITMYSAILRIQPDGGMYTYGFPAGATSSSDRIFLDGISYHIGS